MYKAYGFLVFEEKKKGILRAIKESNHIVERPTYGVPEIRPRATLVEGTSAYPQRAQVSNDSRCPRLPLKFVGVAQ